LQDLILVVCYQTKQTQASACCVFHQRDVDNFIAVSGAMKLLFLYLLYFPRDRSPQHKSSRHGMAIAFRKVLSGSLDGPPTR
jgi:hypothetical protein